MAAVDYHYVIVGAGSAGCVLAGRLSADPGCRVALLEAGRPLSQAAGLRSDRAGHGRADVDHRRAGPGPDAGRHPCRRPDRRPVLRHRHPDRAAGARHFRRGPMGADLTVAGADLHAGFPGLALADGKGRRQAGRQQPSDLDPDRRVQDLRRLHQHRHDRRADLGTLRAGDRRAGTSHQPRLRHGARALEEPRRAERRRSASSPRRNRRMSGSRN